MKLFYTDFNFAYDIQSPMNRYISTPRHGNILSVDFEEYLKQKLYKNNICV